MMTRSRRALLSSCLATVSTGCVFDVRSGNETPRAADVTVERNQTTGSTRKRIQLSNSYLSVFVTERDLESLVGVSSIGTRDGRPLTDSVEVRPQSPTSPTDSVTPKFERTKQLTVTQPGGRLGQYRLQRAYTLKQTPVDIRWTVTVPGGAPLVLLTVEVQNRGSEAIRIDQDDGDTHDGIQMLSSIGLAEHTPQSDSYRFAIDGGSSTRFVDTPRWQTYPAPRYVTIHDGDRGATFGYIRGDSGPRMAVVDKRSLDLLVNEVSLGPSDSITYDLFGALHAGGAEATEHGNKHYETARNWDWDSLRA